MNIWTVPLAVTKPSDTARNTTTTVTNDPDLQISAASGAQYWLHGTIEYKGTTNGNSDIKFQINAPAGATGFVNITYITLAGLAGSTDNMQVNVNHTAGTNGTANIEPLTFSGVITLAGTAGIVAFAWAQNTSNGTNTTVLAGSALIAQRVG
jgi:hypothetical protein